MAGESKDPRDIISTRRFAAPRDRVFDAYARPERLARWWGPNGFTSDFHHFDFRPGGEWKFTFRGPDGTEYPNDNVFDVIEKDRRIAIRHVSAPGFVLTATFEDESGGTRMTWRQRFDTAELRERLAAVCIPANEENFDRLEAELARG